MLNEVHEANFLTAAEREQFDERGYITLGSVLDAPAIKHFTGLVDAIYQEHVDSGFDPYRHAAFEPQRPFFYPDFLRRDQSFINLLDHPRILPKVIDLLGWNLYCYHSHLIVTPPRPPTERGNPRFGFHQDSGRASLDMVMHPAAMLTVKVVLWLTDVSAIDRGNLYVLPGGHLRNPRELPTDGSKPDGAIPIRATPGDALIFDRRIWHSSSANDSPVTRKGLFLGYGHRWLRPKDEMTITPEIMTRNDPIRRQLLGDSTSNNNRFSPQADDVPIRSWLQTLGRPV